jgi:hypothetical protein
MVFRDVIMITVIRMHTDATKIDRDVIRIHGDVIRIHRGVIRIDRDEREGERQGERERGTRSRYTGT